MHNSQKLSASNRQRQRVARETVSKDDSDTKECSNRIIAGQI